MTITGLRRTDHVDADDAVLGSVGYARSGVDVTVVGPEGNPAAVDEVGEIVCRGDVVMSGYWNNPDATVATLQDGWANAMSNVGTRTQSAQYAANMSTSIADSLESQRVAVSGVNLDEEAARLIQYQQAYQASAKMLQIAQSIFDSLLQTVSR